jgi:hypothetical protein
VIRRQHGGLATLEQHRLAHGVERLVEHETRVRGDHRAQAFTIRERVGGDLIGTDRSAVCQAFTSG